MATIKVRLRPIAYETMMMCFPDSPCTRQAWMDMRGKSYPIIIPLKTIGICARGLPLYETATLASDSRSVGLCTHIADIGDN